MAKDKFVDTDTTHIVFTHKQGSDGDKSARSLIANRLAKTFACGGPGSGVPGPCPTGSKDKPAKGKREPKQVDVKVKAAADKVEAVNAKVTKAKEKLDALKTELKAAKANLKQVKETVKAGSMAPTNEKTVNDKVSQLKDLQDKASDHKNYPTAAIQEAVANLVKLTVADLTAVARGFGISRPEKSRPKMAKQIEGKITAAHRAWLANQI